MMLGGSRNHPASIAAGIVWQAAEPDLRCQKVKQHLWRAHQELARRYEDGQGNEEARAIRLVLLNRDAGIRTRDPLNPIQVGGNSENDKRHPAPSVG